MESQRQKEFNEWTKVYFNKPLIDLAKYLTTEDKEVIEKLKIILEDKIYTEYEFECLEMDLIAFYEKKEQLEELGIAYSKIERLWNICDNVREDYSI